MPTTTTVKRVYELALARVFESPGNDEDYDTYSPALLETLLWEALPYENLLRRSQGRDVLEDVPELTAIDGTELPFDARICRVALPYGLASVILADDESRKAESVMARNEFIMALESIVPGFEELAGEWS